MGGGGGVAAGRRVPKLLESRKTDIKSERKDRKRRTDRKSERKDRKGRTDRKSERASPGGEPFGRTDAQSGRAGGRASNREGERTRGEEGD